MVLTFILYYGLVFGKLFLVCMFVAAAITLLPDPIAVGIVAGAIGGIFLGIRWVREDLGC